MRAAGVLVVASLFASSPLPPSQRPEQSPSFRSGIQLIEVDARVFDRDGRFVTDLTVDDFEIFEGGRRQTIQTMFLVGAPGAAAVESAGGSRAPRAPQTWIFIFDRRHITPNGFQRAKTSVDAFLRQRFRAGDLAGIVANQRMIDDRITSVRGEFLSSLAKVKVPGDAAERAADENMAATADNDEAGENIREALGIMNAAEARRATRDTIDLLDELAGGLAAMPGPKTIVMLSDGLMLSSFEEAVRGTVAKMNRAGARVYAVDTRGIAGPPGDALNSLAVDSGGLALSNLNDLDTALARIAADTNVYYVLGFQPANQKYDGKYHAIDVRVKRPDVKVRARKGYLALQPSLMRVPK